jgi:hypothetical protein
MATATALSLSGAGRWGGGSPLSRRYTVASGRCCAFPRSRWRPPRLAASRADDSSPAPFEMTVEGALKLLGVAEGASFDEILRAKNGVLTSCKDDQDAVAQVPETCPPLFTTEYSFRVCLLLCSASQGKRCLCSLLPPWYLRLKYWKPP